MTGLILKDIYNLSHNIKTLLLMLAAMGVIFIPTSGLSNFLGIVILMCSMMIITTFSFDDMSKWNHYAATLPISRRQIVLSKYLAFLLFIAEGFVLSAVLIVIESLITKTKSFTEPFMVLSVMAGLSLLFGCFLIPLLYKYGAEKARILMILVFLIPTAVSYLGYSTLKHLQLQLPAPQILRYLAYLSPVLLVLIFLLSFQISSRIYQKKDL